ncbi:MAG TPA: TIR domain-containing protein [Solirubrobacteraceae bacterium]|jgi:hypothetical protein|nr:TIR domain-containing protein [Solirubrobacteraceae bacterium]
MGSFDVFVRYAHVDRERVLTLRDALVAQGLLVWFDDREIETFDSISAAIEQGLASSKVLLAFFSQAYPARRACQWELTAPIVAAQRVGRDPRERVLVVNPEDGAAHIEPVELCDALFATAPMLSDAAGHALLAKRVAEHATGLDGMLGELGVTTRPLWLGRRPVGANRFVGRLRDMWAVHSALTAGQVGLIAGAHSGDPAVKVAGMGGVGKSLLTVEYALRFGAAYPGGVFWLRAEGRDGGRDALRSQTRDADRDVQLHGFATTLEIRTDDVEPGEVIGALGAELDRRGLSFLWIVDGLPAGLSASEREAWYAPGRFGRTLMTTRSREYRSVGLQIDLGVLTSDEGYELLLKHRRPDGEAEEMAARGVVEDLMGKQRKWRRAEWWRI